MEPERSDEEASPRTGRTYAERLSQLPGRIDDWILFEGNRYALSLGFLSVAFVVVAWLQANQFLAIGGSPLSLLYLFQSLIAGNITLITIAISINQLVLSRELRSPRELESELDAVREYRQTVEAETERSVIPEDPHDFLQILVENTGRRVAELDAEVTEGQATELRDEIATLQTRLEVELDDTDARLENSTKGVFPALSTIIGADFGSRLNHSRLIRKRYDESLSEATNGRLEAVEERLEQLDIAQEYFKTIYLQQELADVSRLLVYVGLPAEMIAITVLVMVGAPELAPPILGTPLVVPLAITANLAPLTVLAAHVLRIATVARRTAAITPFITPD
jgi:hypothetical protein